MWIPTGKPVALKYTRCAWIRSKFTHASNVYQCRVPIIDRRVAACVDSRVARGPLRGLRLRVPVGVYTGVGSYAANVMSMRGRLRQLRWWRGRRKPR
jgi:hypothetical protein